jgi:tetratricopeptide (TPR) repeat protein
LTLFKELGDRLGTAMAIGGLGLVAWGRGGADSPLEGSACGRAEGVSATEGGYLGETKQFFEESLALCREIGHQSHIQIRLALLGHVSNSMGQYEEAHGYFQEALNLTQQLGKKAEISWIVSGLGEAALGRGDFRAARHYLLEALETHRLLIVVEALVNWAHLLTKEADTQNPPQSPRSGGRRNGGRQKQQAVEILSLALNQTAIAHRYKERAARLLAELEAELPPEVFAAAREEGQAKTVEEMVAKIVGQVV